MATEEEAPAELKVKIGRESHLSTIQRKEHKATIKQLGVATCPEGDFSQAHKVKKDYITAIANRSRKAFISPKNAYQIYYNVWLPSCWYTLSVTNFTKAQCLDIMRPIVNVLVAKMGFNRHMPRVVIYGTRKLG
eukprot:14369172-Ditylum_brightwellii.AAC.1